MKRATRGWLRYRLALVGGWWSLGILAAVLLLAPICNFTDFPIPVIAPLIGFVVVVLAWLRCNPGENAFECCLPLTFHRRMTLCLRCGLVALFVVFALALLGTWTGQLMPWPALSPQLEPDALAAAFAAAAIIGATLLLVVNLIDRMPVWCRMTVAILLGILILTGLAFSIRLVPGLDESSARPVNLAIAGAIFSWFSAPLVARIWPRPGPGGPPVIFPLATPSPTGAPPADGLLAPLWASLLPRRLPARWRIWWIVAGGSLGRCLAVLILLGGLVVLAGWSGHQLYLNWSGVCIAIFIIAANGTFDNDKANTVELFYQQTYGEQLLRLLGRQRLVGRFLGTAAICLALILAIGTMVDWRSLRPPVELRGDPEGLSLATYHRSAGIAREACALQTADGRRPLPQDPPTGVEPAWLATQAQRLLWRDHGVRLPIEAFDADPTFCPWPVAAEYVQKHQWRFDLVGLVVCLAGLLAAYANAFRARGDKPLNRLVLFGSGLCLAAAAPWLWLGPPIPVDPAIGYPAVEVGLVGHWRALVVERTWWLVAAAAVVSLLALAVIWRRARWLRLAP